jgi:hypothetical protein
VSVKEPVKTHCVDNDNYSQLKNVSQLHFEECSQLGAICCVFSYSLDIIMIILHIKLCKK